jgi:hypothetical protein
VLSRPTESKTGPCGKINHLKTVEEPNHIVGVGEARNVGAPATWDSFTPTVGMETDRKGFMFGHLD